MIENEAAKRERRDNYTARALLLPKEMFDSDLKFYSYFETRSKSITHH